MQTGDGRLRRIHSILRNVRGPEALKELFWSELNYDRSNRLLSRRNWTERQTAALADDPVLFATGGEGDVFQVIYARLDSEKLSLSPERLVVSRMLRDHPYALFIFANRSEDRFHLLNIKEAAAQQTAGGRKSPSLIRRITLGPEEKLWTATQRIAMLDIAAAEQTLFGVGPLEIQRQHDEAFDVEAVTKQFFEDYQAAFNALQDDLKKQTRDPSWAHDHALQFLNRLMFLYFVQRKRWLGEDSDFLRSFWEAYQDSEQPHDTFFSKWLSVLFFEAFNNCYSGGHKHFPQHIHRALLRAPYLNGGLFKRNALDNGPGKDFAISDARFRLLFDFLEQYNFTITEDSPVDQEVAVDPEMIGKVYESLVNVSSEADERGDAGIFYTPRTEIDLMCRLALVDNLANHLGQQHKNLLYELVFALEPDDKETADNRVAAAELWDQLNRRLQETTVVDPACGSGSFLVGMLHVLDDLEGRAAHQLAIAEDSYDRKKRIIGQSLYGVDVMEWACHVAELRLWLALIIDADIDTTAAHIRREPLLPHFSFKIRCGDSLIQHIGQVNLAHIKGSKLVPAAVKRKITLHKERKLQFYNNDEDREYQTEDQIREAELRLFREILDAQDIRIDQDVVQLRQRIANPAGRQMNLDGEMEPTPQMQLEAVELQRQAEDLEIHQSRVNEAREALRTQKRVPFVWDIAFVEVFEGDKDGFDIVVGNPPYVRQETISDPKEREDEFDADQWRERKRLYKAKLIRSVYQAYPNHFGPNPDRPTRPLNAKSDLYCYFYFHALSLLNAKGSFSFVTSNSWLDVGYGAELQEFLLRNCRIKLVLDNQVRRSFADADVNTVIVLFSAPQPDCASVLGQTARFAMFTVPFEEIIHPAIFEEIGEAEERAVKEEYRVFPATQQQLLQVGCEASAQPARQSRQRVRTRQPQMPTTAEDGCTGRYAGDKWGGKYLRAPDIYWRILERGKDKLIQLGEIAHVRFGIKTGANDFFYVTAVGDAGKGHTRVITDLGSEHDLPCEMLVPAIVRPGNVRQPQLTAHMADYYMVCIPPLPPADLPRAVRQYISWGESQGFAHRSTLRSRRFWYTIEPREPGWILTPMARKRRSLVGWNEARLQVDHNLFEVLPKSGEGHEQIAASLLSSFTVMQAELFGRANLGQGALKTEGVDIAFFSVLDPTELTEHVSSRLSDSMAELAGRRILMIYDDVKTPDRGRLDDAFLLAVGFDDVTERRAMLCELHDTACRMVWRRLAKPGNARESRQTYDEWLATGQPFGADVGDEDEVHGEDE